MPHRALRASIDEVIRAAANIEWAISVRDAAGDELACHNADHTMEIASVGKLLLLVEVARQLDKGTLLAGEVLGRDTTLHVADSGLWQHFRTEALPIHDLCLLVASVSDNLATNVLLDHIGLQRIRDLGSTLGLTTTVILDYIRDRRGPGVPATFARGSASELSHVMSQLAGNMLVSPSVSQRVVDWLATGADLSMVASAFGLDPLSHAASARNILLRNKTGSDTLIRADVGIVEHHDLRFSYAVICNWSPLDIGAPDAALSGMNVIGAALRTLMESDGGDVNCQLDW